MAAKHRRVFKLSTGVEISQKNERGRGLLRNIVMNIVHKSFLFLGKRAINVKKFNPLPIQVNFDGSKKAFMNPRGQAFRKVNLVGGQVLSNQNSDSRMRPVNSTYLSILLFGGESPMKEMKPVLFSFESGGSELELSELGFLQGNDIPWKSKNSVNVGKASVAIVCNKSVGGRDGIIESTTSSDNP